MPEFYMILARKIIKIPEFYMIFARKMPEFYVIIARKIFCPPPCPPVSYAYELGDGSNFCQIRFIVKADRVVSPDEDVK